MQVISAFSLMVSAMVAFKGVQARLCAMGVLICVMTKHLTIDGLVPPPPVMAMTAVVLLTNLLAPEVWGKRTFVGFCLLNALYPREGSNPRTVPHAPCAVAALLLAAWCRCTLLAAALCSLRSLLLALTAPCARRSLRSPP